jgi:tRNA threonylcarbamoyl adenosine modification protein YeaZ
MKLYIDTSDSEQVVIRLNKKEFKASAREEKAQRLLPFIKETLQKEGKKLEDLKEIEVNTGPGSFTGLRVGVSVANALGWTLGIPVNGQDLKKDGMVRINYE